MFEEELVVKKVDVVYTVALGADTRGLLVLVEINPDGPKPTDEQLEYLKGNLETIFTELTGIPTRVILSMVNLWLSFYPISIGAAKETEVLPNLAPDFAAVNTHKGRRQPFKNQDWLYSNFTLEEIKAALSVIKPYFLDEQEAEASLATTIYSLSLLYPSLSGKPMFVYVDSINNEFTQSTTQESKMKLAASLVGNNGARAMVALAQISAEAFSKLVEEMKQKGAN